MTVPLFLLLFATVDLPVEPGDWIGLRSESALVLEVQSGNVEAWIDYCLSGWRLRDQALITDCASNAAEPARSVARALVNTTTVKVDNRWGLRIALERTFLESKFKDTRRLAQRLYELEPDNVWSAQIAIQSASRGGEEAMAYALALRAKERFGNHFDGMVRKTEADLRSAYGGNTAWLFLAGILILTFVLLRQGRQRWGSMDPRRRRRRN
ncbi:MAG: hypothetical protein VX405_04530 [Myxococcota bacterium]|nr:hypothetical protein [Myxococcota bacterium]